MCAGDAWEACNATSVNRLTFGSKKSSRSTRMGFLEVLRSIPGRKWRSPGPPTSNVTSASCPTVSVTTRPARQCEMEAMVTNDHKHCAGASGGAR